MKRSDFLKRLGIGLGAVVVAPKVVIETIKEEPKIKVEYITPPEYYLSMMGKGGFGSIYDDVLSPTAYGKFIKHYRKIPLSVLLSND